jgi:ATP-dependent Clp protease protease subunit
MSDLIHPLGSDLMAQRYREYTRQRQYGTGDILLDNRIIFLGSTGLGGVNPIIDDLTATATIQSLLYLQYENRNQEIHMYINSPGGSVTSMLAIYDTMQFLECPVVTYCMGLAASAAAVLLSDHTGKPISVIETETERNRYFTAQEAKEFGLVDDVLGKMNTPEKKS